MNFEFCIDITGTVFKIIKFKIIIHSDEPCCHGALGRFTRAYELSLSKNTTSKSVTNFEPMYHGIFGNNRHSNIEYCIFYNAEQYSK